MKRKEIIEMLMRLSAGEKLAIIDALLRSLKEECSLERLLRDRSARKKQLAKAADLLLNDYLHDSELTAFTSLDSEEFYVEK